MALLSKTTVKYKKEYINDLTTDTSTSNKALIAPLRIAMYASIGEHTIATQQADTPIVNDLARFQLIDSHYLP